MERNGNGKGLRPLVLWMALMLPPMAAVQAAETWIDVTDYITNPGFDDNNSTGWTWESSTGTADANSNHNMRFYSGSFDFHQTLSGLPKGKYRLSVQSFYRDGAQDASYDAYLNDSESLDGELYAGNSSIALVSVYSESLDYNAGGRSWSRDNQNYYPDGRNAAEIAFDSGMYWNVLEFTAEGDVTIGVRCPVNTSGNYCVIDNFILEYQEGSNDGWTDVTHYLVNNPGFTDNSNDGWTWEAAASSEKCDWDCMEFWNGTFNIWQDLAGLPSGKFRLSVQAYYRIGPNTSSYTAHTNGRETITAKLYAGSNEQTLKSVYDEEFDENLNWDCWSPNNSNWWETQPPYFPNGMSSGSAAFASGAYWNAVEFTHGGGDLRIGLKNQTNKSENWCLFDNFKLEYYGQVVKATSIEATIASTQILIGEQTQATATILPSNVLSKKVQWTSADEAVATVDANGLVTGVGPGTTTIKATTVDGTKLSATVSVKVMKNPPTSASLVINEIMACNVDEFISPAWNFDGWVEFYNPTNQAVSLADCYLSDNALEPLQWRMPANAGTVPAHGFCVVWFDSHVIAPQNAPFKLDVDGGTIFVSDDNGKLIAQQAYPSSMERVSYARTTDGGDTWGFAAQATPGASNVTATFAQQQLEAPVVDQPSQLFEGSMSINVTIPTGCTLYYTTDGTLPTKESTRSYTGHFGISATTCYRFRLYADGQLPSRVTTRSYILRDKNYYLPVVSVVSDPDFLYSTEYGVMAKGPNGRPGNGSDDNCNWNMDWERPVNFSYLDANGAMVLNQDVDLEMCGGWSRGWTPHSFKLKGTKEMGGNKFLDYSFFGQKPHIHTRTLQIRNGGNDTSCRFKDAALQTIVETSGLDIDCQSYQPVHEFINGNYIGVLNVRETNNKHFIETNYGWSDDEIDQFEMSPDSAYVQKCGTPDAYNRLVDTLSPNANGSAWAGIEGLLDIDEYTNYMAVEMYLGSTDWPQNNVKGFRLRNGGKFRFVLFDVDFAFNTTDAFGNFLGKEYYTFDMLRPASLGQYVNEHIRFVTLFKNLLKNDSFRKRFIDTYCLVGGSVFEPTRSAAILDSLYNNVQPAMRLNGGSAASTYSDVKSRLNSRLSTAINALRNCSEMKLTGVTSQSVKLSSNVANAHIQVNGLDVPTGNFNGTLFPPIVLTAVAPEGYTFQGWADQNGNVVSTSESYDISGKGTQRLTATYTPLATDQELLADLATPVKVNEVSAGNTIYVNEYFEQGDWVELYNTTDTDLDAAGLYLTDDASNLLKYQIPASNGTVNTIIPAKGYLTVWADKLNSLTQVHTNFKLANENSQVVLVSSSDEFVGNNPSFFTAHPDQKAFVDGITYNTHTGEQSVGRWPDGGRLFYKMDRPTIERANHLRTSDKKVGEDKSWMEKADAMFTLDLAKGWNWVSHNLAAPLGRGELSDKSSRILSRTDEAYRDSKLGLTGTLKTLEAGQLYKVEMSADDTFSKKEQMVDAAMPIALKPGWNWIGYPVNGAQDIAHALANLTAEEGDMLLGQDGLATFAEGAWTGSQNTLETGKGYMYKSKSAKTLRFCTPAVGVRLSAAARRMPAAVGQGSLTGQVAVAKHAYPNVMGVIAQLALGADAVATPDRFTLVAYSDGECRGQAQWKDGRLWMNVYGDGGENVSFRAIDRNDGTVYAVRETRLFAADVVGTFAAPLQLTLGDVLDEATAISQSTMAANGRQASAIDAYYSLSGIRVGQRAASLPQGIYIIRYKDGSFRKVCIK